MTKPIDDIIEENIRKIKREDGQPIKGGNMIDYLKGLTILFPKIGEKPKIQKQRCERV